MNHSMPHIATRETLDENCANGVSSIVYDPHGLLSSYAFNAERGDRMLLIEERLTLGDLMLVQSWTSDHRSSVLFVQTLDEEISEHCVGLLFEFAAQNLVVGGICDVYLYPAELERGHFQQRLIAGSEGAREVLMQMRC